MGVIKVDAIGAEIDADNMDQARGTSVILVYGGQSRA